MSYRGQEPQNGIRHTHTHTPSLAWTEGCAQCVQVGIFLGEMLGKNLPLGKRAQLCLHSCGMTMPAIPACAIHCT